LSFVTTLSASTNVVEEADVSPSMMFSSVAVAVTPSKMFNSAVVDVTPSSIFSSAVVDVTPSNILSSVVVDVTPSSMFISVAVAVTATSSFIFGDVNVLFVRVAVEVAETSLASPPVLGNVRTLLALSECGAAIIVCP